MVVNNKNDVISLSLSLSLPLSLSQFLFFVQQRIGSKGKRCSFQQIQLLDPFHHLILFWFLTWLHWHPTHFEFGLKMTSERVISVPNLRLQRPLKVCFFAFCLFLCFFVRHELCFLVFFVLHNRVLFCSIVVDSTLLLLGDNMKYFEPRLRMQTCTAQKVKRFFFPFASFFTHSGNKIAPQIIPENVTCQALDSKSMKISWTVPGSAESLFIEGFYIGYRAVSSLEPFTYKTMHISLTSSSGTDVDRGSKDGGEDTRSFTHWSDPSSLSPSSSSSSSSNFPGNMILQQNGQTERRFEYIVDSLRKATKYSVIVQAFNSKGAGPSTSELTVETFVNGMSPLSLSLFGRLVHGNVSIYPYIM